MAEFMYGLLLFVITVLLLTSTSKATDYDEGCSKSAGELPIVEVSRVSVLGLFIELSLLLLLPLQ